MLIINLAVEQALRPLYQEAVTSGTTRACGSDLADLAARRRRGDGTTADLLRLLQQSHRCTLARRRLQARRRADSMDRIRLCAPVVLSYVFERICYAHADTRRVLAIQAAPPWRANQVTTIIATRHWGLLGMPLRRRCGVLLGPAPGIDGVCVSNSAARKRRVTCSLLRREADLHAIVAYGSFPVGVVIAFALSITIVSFSNGGEARSYLCFYCLRYCASPLLYVRSWNGRDAILSASFSPPTSDILRRSRPRRSRIGRCDSTRSRRFDANGDRRAHRRLGDHCRVSLGHQSRNAERAQRSRRKTGRRRSSWRWAASFGRAARRLSGFGRSSFNATASSSIRASVTSRSISPCCSAWCSRSVC